MKRNAYFGILLGLLVVMIFTSLASGQMAMTRAEIQTLGDRYMEARNSPDLDLLDTIFDADAVIHDASAPGDLQGLAALKTYYTRSHTIYPDLQITLDNFMISGDHVIWYWTFTGTNTGPLDQMPPTGKSVKFSGIAIDHMKAGKVIEEWVYFNQLDMMMQLGFTLAPPAQEE
jgi:steroid delta-isomerase-like uncharacterized protein